MVEGAWCFGDRENQICNYRGPLLLLTRPHRHTISPASNASQGPVSDSPTQGTVLNCMPHIYMYIVHTFLSEKNPTHTQKVQTNHLSPPAIPYIHIANE